jgi:hypothetical protein
MAGLGTQSAIERAELVTPRLTVRAPRFYPNNLPVRIWRGPGVGNCPGLLYSCVFGRADHIHCVNNLDCLGNLSRSGESDLETALVVRHLREAAGEVARRVRLRGVAVASRVAGSSLQITADFYTCAATFSPLGSGTRP